VFPSVIEHNMWRTASVLTTLLPPLLFWLDDIDTLSDHMPEMVMVYYVFIRIYLLVEPFVGLRDVPAGVYQDVQWTHFVPHI
jgi:hypothetical protein